MKYFVAASFDLIRNISISLLSLTNIGEISIASGMLIAWSKC